MGGPFQYQSQQEDVKRQRRQVRWVLEALKAGQETQPLARREAAAVMVEESARRNAREMME